VGLTWPVAPWGPPPGALDRKDGTVEIVERIVLSELLDEPGHNVITTSSNEFARAVRLHQAGELDAAARLYEWVLDDDRTHADALHLLGMLRHQQGQNRLAANLIGRAVALRPLVPVFHASLAEVHRALGQFEQAVACGREAIRLGLDDPAAHNNLGLALHVVGRHVEAAAAFLAVLESRPEDVMAHTNLGAALRELGDKSRALEHMKRAVELDPQLASARNNLGQFLLESGRPDQALPHCQAAVALQPEMAEAHNNLGNVYRALGHFPEARWCYGEAVRKNPAMSHACVSLALTLQLEGRWDEALPWLRRALEIQPDSLDYRALLAEAEVDREHFAEAIDCYQEIIKRDPGDGTAHNALGWLLQEEGQLDLSAGHLRTALRLQPDLAVATVTLGSLHEKMGDFAAAEACFRSAVDDDQARSHALARLAMLLRGKLPDDDCKAIEERLESDANATDPARLNLFFGLANVWDARQRYPEAAACARQANALALAQFQRRNMVHDPAEHERFVSGLIEGFEPGLFKRLENAGLETRRPVFIVGLARSGTTLIEQILASHSEFYGAGELPMAGHDFQAIPGLLESDLPPVSCIALLTRAVVHQLAVGHDDKLRSLDGGRAARIGDKMPDNYIHLGLLTTLFPNAVFIHCRRDLRDVAVSCWMTGFRSVRWTNDLHHIATRFQQYDRLMKHWQAVLPTSIHIVDYEQTVDDLEGVARRLLDACGLDWEPACLEFHRNSRPVQTASFSQVRQPVYRGSVGRWKNYETELADLFAALPV
jgi:tetratricopeptide (TPR) repeat protein